MAIGSSTPLSRYITTLIQITAKRQVGRYGYAESDRDDLEQLITMEVIRRRAKFDPGKAQENTFLARLVTHALADIIAARKAACRDYRREKGMLSQWVRVSSSSHPLYNEWASRGELVTEDDSRRHLGKPALGPDELRDLSIDVATAAAALPDHLRDIATQLKELGSARAVAAAMGLHHSTVSEAVKQIKEHFLKAGLDDYLPNRQTAQPDRFGHPPVGNPGAAKPDRL